MLVTYLSEALRCEVIARANHCCEYCLIPNSLSFYAHEVDHVIAIKHGGQTLSDNLAYACWRCNRHKGSDLGSFDPETGEYSFLFNPRNHFWIKHFRLEASRIIGITPEGRTTVRLLKLNSEERIQERQRQGL